MQAFNVHVLGCGSAKPTTRHYPSSQVVEIRGKLFMVDCGEGTQTQLSRMRISFSNLNHVFISHLHGDHCFGLIGMISSFGILGRVHPLHIYADRLLEPVLKAQLELFCTNLEYDVVFHAVDTSKCQVIYEDRSLTVTSIPLEHRVPCCGFLFREKPTLPHIRRDMIDFYKIPFSQINNIKMGQSWITDDGVEVPASRLTLPADAPRSYAYCSDTRYFPQLAGYVRDVNLLYHESTYAEDKVEGAAKYYHSTAMQAATIARNANVGQLMLGHYSARYNNEELLLEEARTIFKNTILANEKLVVSVK
ncbi:MAG: ribonuclease Z [Prevotella sp.]|nr:ribonuclease Z [Prevotella sp.]